MKKACLFFLLSLSVVLITASNASATIQIPRNLDKNDREEALRILGLSSSAKILSDPYPLGGYAGFEVGVSVENLPTQELGHLGSTLSSPQQDVAYPKITLGKGLYNNIDLFLQFTPYNRQDELSHFGGLARWGFYQAKFLPATVSLLLHMNAGNISNLVTTRSYGIDLMTGINVDHVGLFAGIGPIQAQGTFMGGADGVTDTNEPANESVSGIHTVIGANIKIERVSLTLQIDRYTLPVISGKLGLRF